MDQENIDSNIPPLPGKTSLVKPSLTIAQRFNGLHLFNIKILSFVVIIFAIPLTVLVSMQQQSIRQRASSVLEPISNLKPDAPLKYKGYIVKLKTSVNRISRNRSISSSSENALVTDKYKQDREVFKNDALRILNKKYLSKTSSQNILAEDEQTSRERLNVLGEYSNVFNGVALDINDQEANSLRGSSLVESVYKNEQVKADLYQSVPLVNADSVWQDKDSSGEFVTGKDVRIAVIDSGVDYTHSSLGKTIIDERAFTKIYKANGTYDFSQMDSMSLDINGNKFAYIAGLDRVGIYDFNTKKKVIINLNTTKNLTNRSIKGLKISGDYILYYSSGDYQGSLRIYKISNKTNKKISDLKFKNRNKIMVGLFALDNKFVYYTKAANDQDTGNQRFKLIKYNIVSAKEEVLASDVNDGYFFKDKNLIAFQNTVSDIDNCNARNIVLKNITTDERSEVSSPNMGQLQDYNNNKLLYYPPCASRIGYKSLYLYDLKTKTEKLISYTKDITGAEITGEALISVAHAYPYANKIGNGVVFFNKNVPNPGEKLIAYDYTKDSYAQITLKTRILNAIAVLDKKVCFIGEVVGQIYCHQYDPNYNYPLPTTIFNSKIVDGYNFLTGEADPLDDYGHGTHVAGIAAGNGNLKGVAKDAMIVGYKVLDSSGLGWSSDIIAAIDKAIETTLDDNSTNDIDVINLSLGRSCYSGYIEECGPNDILSQSVDRASSMGISVVVSAGNSGPSDSTVTSPATARTAISVGAVDKKKKITSFSSRGPVIFNSEDIHKPDIVAPGDSICSAKFFDSSDGSICGGYVGNFIKHGTSMAAPHVAGAIALIKQIKPELSVAEIKNLIKDNALDLSLKEKAQGAGMLDLRRIVDSIL